MVFLAKQLKKNVFYGVKIYEMKRLETPDKKSLLSGS